jgi:SAM-dependent methyltransferase
MYKRWQKAQKAEEKYNKRHAIVFQHADDMRRQPIEFMRKCTRLTEDELNRSRIVEIGGGQLALTFSNLNDTSKIILDPLLIFSEACNVSYNKVRAVGEYLPFPDGSIDICWCMNVIDHVISPPKMLQEIRRALRNNGMLVISCHAFPGISKPLIPLLNYLDSPHPHHFTEGSLYKLLTQYFKVVRLPEQVSLKFRMNQNPKTN